MIRPLLLSALVAAGTLTACKPSAPATPPGDSPAASATPPGSPAGPGARPQAPPLAMPPPVPGPVAIDDKTVEKFIAYDKKYLANLPQRMQAMRDELRKVEAAQRAAGAAGRSQADAAARGVLEKMKSQDAAMRAELGLSEAEAQTMQELAMALSAVKTRKADLVDATKKFGERSVAVAQRHEAELVALWEQHMKVFQDAMKMMMQK